jgi:hypothetical protein
MSQHLQFLLTDVTLNVTLDDFASSTNVTLGLEPPDGNVTLPGQGPVGVTPAPAVKVDAPRRRLGW